MLFFLELFARWNAKKWHKTPRALQFSFALPAPRTKIDGFVDGHVVHWCVPSPSPQIFAFYSSSISHFDLDLEAYMELILAVFGQAKVPKVEKNVWTVNVSFNCLRLATSCFALDCLISICLSRHRLTLIRNQEMGIASRFSSVCRPKNLHNFNLMLCYEVMRGSVQVAVHLMDDGWWSLELQGCSAPSAGPRLPWTPEITTS